MSEQTENLQVEQAPVETAPKQVFKADEPYTLKSGKTVIIRELSMLDDLLLSQWVGEGLTEDKINNNRLGLSVMQSLLECVLALEEYDGKPVDAPKDTMDAMRIMKTIPKRDGEEILSLCQQLNKDVDLKG